MRPATKLSNRQWIRCYLVGACTGHRVVICEVLKKPKPQPYTLTKDRPRRMLTDAYQQQIEEILRQDESAPPQKQRHTLAVGQRVNRESRAIIWIV